MTPLPTTVKKARELGAREFLVAYPELREANPDPIVVARSSKTVNETTYFIDFEIDMWE